MSSNYTLTYLNRNLWAVPTRCYCRHIPLSTLTRKLFHWVLDHGRRLDVLRGVSHVGLTVEGGSLLVQSGRRQRLRRSSRLLLDGPWIIGWKCLVKYVVSTRIIYSHYFWDVYSGPWGSSFWSETGLSKSFFGLVYLIICFSLVS